VKIASSASPTGVACRTRLDRFRLCALDGGGFSPLAVADLLGRELASANAATPARRGDWREYRRRLLTGALGSDQFATAVWTLSLNHSLLHEKCFLMLSGISC